MKTKIHTFLLLAMSMSLTTISCSKEDVNAPEQTQEEKARSAAISKDVGDEAEAYLASLGFGTPAKPCVNKNTAQLKLLLPRTAFPPYFCTKNPTCVFSVNGDSPTSRPPISHCPTTAKQSSPCLTPSACALGIAPPTHHDCEAVAHPASVQGETPCTQRAFGSQT